MAESKEYDWVIVGGGYGGNICSSNLAREGQKVCIVEKRGKVGGTCLYEGCIPSKCLLNSSNKYYEAKNHMKQFGVEIDNVKLDYETLMKKKEHLLETSSEHIKQNMKNIGVDVLEGTGRLLNKHEVEIDNKGQKTIVRGKNILINVGGEPAPLPGNIIPIDGKKVIVSTQALSLQKLPKSMIVVGGGFIGLELGSHYNKLGVDVTIVEFLDRVLPMVDQELSHTIKEILEKQGLKILLNTKVTGGKVTEENVTVTVEDAKGGNAKQMEGEILFVATGRRVVTKDIGLELAGVELDKFGRIIVNDKLQSNIPNIYAIGDCSNRGPPLAHKSEDEAFALFDQFMGRLTHLNYDHVPTVIYTHPEVASVGKSEEQLKAENVEYKVGKFNFSNNSRAKCVDETEGFCKVLACKKSGKVLGIHMIGLQVGEQVQEGVFILEQNLTVDLVARTTHAHPGFGECLKSAAIACSKVK